MNDTFTRLLANVPGVDKSANAVNSLALNGVGTVSLQNNMLYITSGSASKTIDLNGITVSQMVSQLPNGITVTLYQDGMAELLMLPYQATNATLPVTLEIATSPTWLVTETLARLFDANRQSLAEQSAQLNLPAAMSRILDWWGASMNVPRMAAEPDPYYVNRIIGLKFRANVNNMAIDQFFETLGYTSQTVDTAPSQFSTTVQMPLSKPTSFVADSTYFTPAINSLKAAGVIGTIILQYALSDALSTSESITYLNAIPGNGQLWGSGRKWGQGHWYPPTQYTPPSSITTKIHEFASASDSITSNITTPPYTWGNNRKWGQSTYST